MIAKTYLPKKESNLTLAKKREIETGFPSPATDHLESRLNLNELLVKYPSSTFFSTVKGDSENNLGLYDGDVLVIDRSLAPKNNSLVIAEIDSEFRVCRIVANGNLWVLEKGNGEITELTFNSELSSPVWGRVTHIIHPV